MNYKKAYIADSSNTNFKNVMDPLIKRILCARGIRDDQALNTSFSSMTDPYEMKDMRTAVELLAKALAEKQRVLIVGDYDVDGATAAALICRALRAMGALDVDFIVPNRFDYGYGLSPEIAEVVMTQSPDVVITVDNGISSIEGVAFLKDRGVTVIITDHHLPGDELPGADAILNPNQAECGFSSKALAGVGVAFYLMLGLRRELRLLRWFQENGIHEPKLEQYLDLVALGTVADLVPLDHLNRILVVNGLKLIQSECGNPGIRALFEVSGKDIRRAVSQDMGFAIGPRINAAGRLDDISEGILCLLAENYAEARGHALNLHHINQERREIQQQMTDEAHQALSAVQMDSKQDLPWGICCYEQSWHQGIVGLVASKVKESLHRPTVAFAPANADAPDNNELKGSARSVAKLHIRDLLAEIATENPSLIKKFGGHAMAAGLSISASQYDHFSDVFDVYVRKHLNAEDLEQVHWTDGELEPEHFNMKTAEKIADLLPWGQGIPEPVFSGDFVVENYRWLKNKHLKLVLQGPDSEPLQAIWFNAEPISDLAEGSMIGLLFRLEINDYRGQRNLQLNVVNETHHAV